MIRGNFYAAWNPSAVPEKHDAEADGLHEEWVSGTGVSNTAVKIREQLPIGQDLEGIPWCKEDYTTPLPM